jgi:hypothetical protein
MKNKAPALKPLTTKKEEEKEDLNDQIELQR